MSETQPNPAAREPTTDFRDAGAPPPPPAPPEPPPRRRRRRWPWVILIILLVLIGLVVLAPTIASTGPVRSFVVGQINEGLNGRIAVGDWSLGWFSGIRLRDVKVYDEDNAQIAHLPLITTELKLTDAARGNFALGQTVVNVASFVARVDESGRTNFERLAKEPAKKPSAPASDETALPDVSGHITVNIDQGTIQTPDNPPVHVGKSSAVLDISDINQPIGNDVKLAFRVGDASRPGTVTAAGTVDVADDNQLSIDKIVADQKVALSNVDLAAAAPFVKGVQLGGVSNGALEVKAPGGISSISAAGEIVVENFLAGGEALNGDTFETSRLAIPVQITRTMSGDTALIKIERLGVQMPEATVAVVGQVPEQAIQNLLDKKKPGAAGDVQINVNVPNIAALANQLPNTLKLQEGVTIESGTLAQVSNIVITPDTVNASQTLDLTAQGTNNGRLVQLSPIHLETTVTAIPTGQDLPDLRNLKLMLQSAFATVNGGGESLAAMKVNGRFDLDKLQSEAAQFADLGEVKLAGTGDFEVTTSGDPTNEKQPIAANAKLNLNNVTVAGVGAQPVQQERLAVAASGKLLRDQNVLQDAALAVTSGDPRAPLLDLNASANVNLKDNSLPQFALTKLNVSDLKRVQDQFGAFVPALAENKIRIDGGSLNATVAGSYANDTLTMTQPLVATVSDVTVSRDGKPILSRETIATNVNGTVSTKGGIAANLSDLSLTSQSNLVSLTKAGQGPLVFSMGEDGTPRGNGAVTIGADLKRLNELAQAFGGQVVTPDQPQLASGLFNGTVTLAKADQPQTNIEFNGELTQVTVTRPQQQGNALENEKVTIALKAVVPDNLQGTNPVTAEGSVNSSFAETKLSDVRVLPGAGTWDMVQSAKVNARIPDLPKLYALLNALAPTAPPAPDQRQASAVRREVTPVMLAMLQQDIGDQPISRPRDRQPDIGDQPISRPRREEQREREPAPAAQTEPQEPLAPLEVTSGGATVALDVSRDRNAKRTTINVTDARVSRLALRRGTREYRFDREQPISIKLAADVNAAGDTIDSINVSQLSGDLRVANLSAPKPITLTNLGADTPNANGAVRVEGELANLTPLLAVLQGADPLPYAGAFVMTQNVATQGEQLTLDGEIAATKFQVLDPADRTNVVFTEDKLTVTNALTADQTKKVAQIRALTVDMASSGAVKLDVKGQVERWGEKTDAGEIVAIAKGIVADVNYDLAKLWPIVRPFVATAEDPMDDVAVEGQFSKQFRVDGPYYAGALHEALRDLQVGGELSIAKFVYPGIEVRDFNLPVNLRRGVLKTEYAGRGGAERFPAPAAFNGGSLSIGNITIDITRPAPRITMPKNYKLVQNASINPLLGDTLGKYVNPVFTNSKRAQGLLDATIKYCEDLALDEKLKTADSGRAQIVFSLRDMDIANPTGSLMFGAIPGVSFGSEQADTFRGQIKDAVVTIDNGVVTEDITLEMIDPGQAADVIGSRQPVEPTVMPLRFQGNVNLGDLSQRINVSIPTALLGRFFRSDKDRQVFAKIFPEGVPLTLTGTTVAPKVDPGNIAQRIIEGQVKGLIDPSGEGGAGGLLEELLKRDRDKDKDRKNR